MKRSELIKLLKRSGCKLKRHGSRHDVWLTENGKQFSVPRHVRELPMGTCKAIIKEANIAER